MTKDQRNAQSFEGLSGHSELSCERNQQTACWMVAEKTTLEGDGGDDDSGGQLKRLHMKGSSNAVSGRHFLFGVPLSLR